MKMVKQGERFFTALGFDPLPKTFWERSLFTRPRDRDVVCHASAWDVSCERRPAHQGVHRADRGGLRHDPPRARPRLLLPALRHAPDPLPAGRQRRLPRGHRRHDRAERHARYLQEPRPAPDAAPQAGRPRAHQPADEDGAREGGVPALRPPHRQVALGRLLRQDRRPTDYNAVVVGAQAEVPGRERARAPARPTTSTPARSTTWPSSTPYVRVLPRAHLPVPVPPGALQGGGLHGPARPVLDPRQQGRGREAHGDARRWARASPGPTRSRRSARGRKADAGADARVLRAASRSGSRTRTRARPCGW